MSADEPIRPDLPDETMGDEHLEWRLSALLDGELSVTEELVAREHLAGCDLCQDEFAEVMAARALVRGLGEVDLPKGTIERTVARVQRRYQTRLGLFGLLAIALAWIALLLLGAGIGPPSVTPPVDTFVAQHDLAARDPDQVPLVFGGRLLDDTEVEELGAPFVLPASLADSFERSEAFAYDDDTVQGVYRDEAVAVSLFEQQGRLDWDDLPPGGTTTELGGRTAWVTRHGEAEVIVVPWEHAVFTLVGDDVERLVPALPEPQPYTLGERIQQSAEGVLRRLGID